MLGQQGKDLGVLGFKPPDQFTNVVNRRLSGKRSIGSMTQKKIQSFSCESEKLFFAEKMNLITI